MMSLYKLYETSPVFLQNAFCSLYGFRQQWQFYGGDFSSYYEQYRKNEHLSLDELQDMQLRALRQLMERAYVEVPFYRQRSERAEILGQPLDWNTFFQLPFLEKETVRRQPRSLLSENRTWFGTATGKTSGTTGTPLTITYTHTATRKIWAAMERLRAWGGVSRSERRASFSGKMFVPASEARQESYWRHDWFGKRMLLSVYHLNDDTIDQYVEALRRFSPAFLDGYPSMMRRIARHLTGTNSPPISSVRALFPTAETLTPNARAEIERGFDARVHNQYGSTEMAAHVGECDYGNLHISPEIGIIEILNDDGKPTPAGEVGNIVVTGLVNHAMPLIRYKIGDMAVAVEPSSRCSCGRSLPLIGPIVGRRDDLVQTEDGRLLPIMNYHVFKWAKNIKEGQLVQEDYRTFTMLVVPEEGKSVELRRSIEELKARLGYTVEVKIEYVNRIERTERMKYRGVTSRLL